MFIHYYLPVTIIPLLICAGFLWYYRGLPAGTVWSVVWRGLLIAPICVCLLLEIPFMKMNVSAPTVYDNCLDIFHVTFFGAAIPEEIGKLVTLYYIVWRVYKWKTTKFSDTFLCALLVGASISITENLFYAQMGFVWRLFAFSGHFSYAIVMGFMFSLLHYTKIQKHRWLVGLGMIATPILVHGLWDAFGKGLLSIYDDWRSTLIFLSAILLPIGIYVLDVYLIVKVKKIDNTPSQ